MTGDLEERLGAGLARGVDAVRRRASGVLALAAALTVLAGGLAATRLGVNADADALFDAELPFRRDRAELDRAIPAQRDTILVVLDDAPPRTLQDAAGDLAEQVRAEPERFRGAFAPGAGPFFERHGLLYLSQEELDALVDRLAQAQPFLAALARDPSLRGVFDQLARALRHRGRAGAGLELEEAMRGVERALEVAGRLEVRPRAFEELLLGDLAAEGRRFVVVTPDLDFGELDAGRAALERLRAIGAELDLPARGVRMRLTGEMALQAEELASVRDQAAAAGAASFVLVATILGLALRSLRLVLATLLTLAAGLVCTAGFAAVAVGHLNMISAAFAVLFIGLGVDFGIHFTLRYGELRAHEAGPAALAGTARSVGPSLVLCAITTAIGFLAFVPTGYRGVAELGVIAGAGMGISLLASLTLLPALLAVRGGVPASRPGSPTGRVPTPSFPTRRPGWVCGVAVAVGLVSLAVAPRLHFDANPLHVRDPGSEAVRTFEELLGDDRVNPLSIEVLAPDLEAADALARRLDALPEVARAMTLSDWIPQHQDARLARIEEIAFMLPLDVIEARPAPDREAVRASMEAFAEEVRALAGERGAMAEAARALRPALEGFLDSLREEPGAAAAANLAVLHESLVAPVMERLARLERSLAAEPVTREDLPVPLRELMLARDGRARVQVLPDRALDDEAVVERFVGAVRAVAPRATGAAVYMLESEDTIVRALRDAFALAAALVFLVLALLWRSLRDASLALAPLVLAALATAAAAVAIGLPINFANVIVLPLIIGIGIDSGIHLVHRHRLGGYADLLETSTSRAVVWSALTTIASFGSLGLASHRGMATLGQLLTLGVAMTVLANLLFLPALLALLDRRRRPGDR